MDELQRRIANLSPSKRALLEAHLARMGEDTGAGSGELVAYIVPRPGEKLSVDELRGFLLKSLPEYMVPSSVMMLEGLPLNASGKVDLRALPDPEPFRTPRVAPPSPVSSDEDGLEAEVARIFAEVLQREAVGPDEDFFRLGGHSLMATQIVARLSRVLSRQVPQRVLFEAPTVAGVVRWLRSPEGAATTTAQATAAQAGIPRAQRSAPLPLSFAQQRLWFLDQLRPGTSTFNIPAAVRLRGALDAGALERSLSEILRRHETLRTVFPSQEGHPVQQVLPPSPLALPVVELQALPADAQARELERRLREETLRPFDLAEGPLLRPTLYRLGREDHVLQLVMHHIVSDGWSLGVLVRELAALYEAFSAGRPSPLPELPIQYADFASWQRSEAQQSLLEEQRAYWTKALAGLPSLLALPTDRSRPAEQSHRGATVPFEVPRALADGLMALSREHDATLFMTLLAAFQVLMHRYTGQADLAVGTDVASRGRTELEGLIGFFVNQLTMRAHFQPGLSFRELLLQARSSSLEAFAYQDLPFEDLVRALNPERSLGHSPLFQVKLILQNAPIPELALGGLKMEPVNIERGSTQFDLLLSVEETPQGLSGYLEYSTDLFDAETALRMAGHLRRLLEAVVAQPELPVKDLPLLPEAERHRLLVEWNSAAAPVPELPVHRLFEQQAARTPDALAVVSSAGRLTYGELNRRANQLARHLSARGVRPEVLVGLCVERSPDLLVGVLGILKAGGAYLPLDASYPSERLAFMLREASAPVLVAHGRLADELPSQGEQLVLLDEDAAAIAREKEGDLLAEVPASALAYILYTSGSTGRPKGVMVTHGGLAAYLAWSTREYRLQEGQGAPVHSAIGFDLTVTSLLAPLVSGRCVTLVPEDARVEGLGEALRSERDFSLVKLTPAHLTVLSHQLSGEEAAGRTRAFIIGGEALTAEALAFWRRHAPSTRLINEYGPTETVVGCCIYEVQPGESLTGTVPIGRPTPNTRLYVLDSHLQLCPVGVPGELFIGGLQVGRGYLRRPELTAERFMPEPFSGQPGARMYRTGDLARWRADGNLEFLGRLDHQVKVRGFRIELGEIEAALSNHFSVREAAVVVREDAPGERRLVGYVVPQPGDEMDVPSLLEALRRSLPEYMVPAALVVLKELPLTSNGKVNRAALPAPERQGDAGSRQLRGPRNPTEEALAAVWAQVLRRPQVGIDDNFFELGGDSILAIQAVAGARKMGLDITPRQLFEHKTISALAAVVGSAPAIHAEQGAVSGPVPLTPVQRWFFEQDVAEPRHHNQALLLEVRQPLEVGQLEAALRALLSHHDALRTRFTREGTLWTQRTLTVEESLGGQAAVTVKELSALSGDAEQQALEAAASEAQAGLDLTRGPLLRAVVLRGGTRPERLLLVIHHLVVDAVSWRILLEDLQTALQQLPQGAAVRLPAKTTSYKEWSERLGRYADSNGVVSELEYWISQPWTEVRRLPVDDPSGMNSEGSTRTLDISLDQAETEALLLRAGEAYRTRVDELLLAALARALTRQLGAGAIQVDLEGHGREPLFEDVDLSRTVGWFTSIFPVLLRWEASWDSGQGLKAIKEALRTVPGRGLGFGILKYLRDTASTAAALRVVAPSQIAFNYLGQLDGALPHTGTFTQALEEGSGPSRSPKATRRYLLEVTARVAGSRLEVSWAYSENLYRRETVESLAASFREALRGLLQECLRPDAGGVTPSDFPLARVEQQHLDRLLKQPRQVEDLYPLSPMQQGFWSYALYASGSGVGIEQSSFVLQGALEVRAFEQAWQKVLERHPVLRTSFLAELAQPLQVVHRRVGLPIDQQDWRHLPPEQRREELAAYLREDLRRGFNLAHPPLIRLALLRTAEDTHHVVLSHHHLLLDGWSVPLVLREVISFYDAILAGKELELPRPRPYRDYIAWCQRQDPAQSEAHWRKALVGFTAPTPLVIDRNVDRPVDEAGHRSQVVHFSRELSARLGELARGLQITPSTLFEAAWAWVLSCYSGEGDVVFGTTVSGRPAELPGIEEMVGMFINVLPTRVQVSRDVTTAAWLRELHARRLEHHQHEHTPLIQIQQWSQVPPSESFFESLIVFENYPVRAPDLAAAGGHGLKLREVEAPVRTRYRLTLVVVPGEELALHADYDARHFDEETIARLLGHLRVVLEGFPTAIERPLAELPLLTAEERALLERSSTRAALGRTVVLAGGAPAPIGIPGEVRKRGTATGEIGRYLPDGALELLGRAEEVVRIRGNRVLPGEVAAALGRHPSVLEAEVVAREGRAGEQELVAYVVPAEGQELTAGDIRAFLKERLPVAFLPSAIMLLPELPRRSTGRVELSQLPSPDAASYAMPAAAQTAPRTATEAAVARSCAELLRVHEVPLDADFFELGGQSLLAIQLVSRLRSALRMEVPIRLIFEGRTVAGMAALIDQLAKEGGAQGVDPQALLSPFERSPLVRQPPKPYYELSPYQIPEWYFAELAPDSPMYNILSCDVLLVGDLDLEVMARAFELVASRHAVFRTYFGYVEGKVVQFVRPEWKITAKDIYLDYRHVPEERFLEETTKLAHEYAQTTLELRSGPLFRFNFAEFPGKRFLMLFLTNHILWDEASHINFSAEIREAYNALRAGRPPRLPELELQYADYAEWVNRGVESGVFERERQYWLKRYADNPPALDLPTDFPRPPRITFNGSAVDGVLPRETTRRLIDDFLKRHSQYTLSMFLHSIVALLLHRLSGQKDIIIGIPIVNRGDQKLERLMGAFATGVPMRSLLLPDMTFEQLLSQVRQETIDAVEHYAYPSVLAIQEINPTWDWSRTRLFSVMYGLQHNKTRFWHELTVDGVRTERMEHLQQIGPLHSTARTDLRFVMEELGPDIIWSFAYNSDLFKHETAERMSAQFISLVQQALQEPGRSIRDFSLMLPGEHERVLGELSTTRAPVETSSTLPRLIQAQMARTPDAVAVEGPEGSLTYAELERRALGLAHRLRALGVGPETPVAVCMERSLEAIVAILGILEAGGTYLPLEPGHPAERLAQVLRRANVPVLLTHAAVRHELAGAVTHRLVLETAGVGLEGPSARLDSGVGPESVAYVLHTSGSTGEPKGVMIPHRAICNRLLWGQQAHPVGASDAVLQAASLAFDVSIWEIFTPLVTGARLVLAPPGPLDAKELVRLIEERRVTKVGFVPSLLKVLVEDGGLGRCTGLRYIFAGAEALSPDVARLVLQALPGVKLYNFYGPTETTIDATFFPCEAGCFEQEVPIGRPVGNARVYVLDEWMRPTALGVAGELYVGGPGVARGYLGRADLTAERFVPDPFSGVPGARMYRTGDRVRMSAEGQLYFLGRVDRQVKVRGNRVEIGEIEKHLLAHPAVRAGAVRLRGEGHSGSLVGYVELREKVCTLGDGAEAHRVYTLAQRPELKPGINALNLESWPEYFNGDEIARRYWPRLASEFARLQFALVDSQDQVVAAGHAIPMRWNGTVEDLPQGWGGGMERAFRDAEAGVAPDTLLVLAGVVAREAGGKGLSALLLQGFKALARKLGLVRVVVPVRPTGKADRPDLGFEAYCELRRPDGLPVDNWLRVHERLGARQLKVELRSQYVRGTLQQWEQWTGQKPDRTGDYHLKGTLQAVRVDLESGVGEYYDPSVWMEHPVDGGAEGFELVDGEILRADLLKVLPAYMVPESFCFLPRMPLTASGKVDERALPAGPVKRSSSEERVPPQGPVQEKLAEIWRAVLKLEAVGVTDNFYELGGDSLRGLALLAKMTDAFAVKLPLREFLKEPTIRGLERFLAASADGAKA